MGMVEERYAFLLIEVDSVKSFHCFPSTIKRLPE